MFSIRDKAKQADTGLISNDEYAKFMKDYHPNLTFGDWGVLMASETDHNTIAALKVRVDKLKRDLEVEKVNAYLNTPVPGSWVVVHTSVNYDPHITLVPAEDCGVYFTNDNGWDGDDIYRIANMKSGQHQSFEHSLANLSCAAISITRV